MRGFFIVFLRAGALLQEPESVGIAALAAIVGAIVDIVLVGIPAKGPDGLEAGPLSDFIRKKFDEVFFQLLLSR